MRGRMLGLVCLSLAVAACERERVKVTIEPRADGSFTRTVRLWREDTEKPGVVLPPTDAALAAAKAIHGEPVADPAGGAAVTFRGVCRAVPADLAPAETPNHGAYDAFRCGAGWCGLYRERRPGPTDYHARFEAAAKAVDFGAKLQIELARKFLAGDPGLPALTERLEGPWRRDMRDVLLMLMTSVAGSSGRREGGLLLGIKGPGSGPAAMAFELLEERGYVRVPEIVALLDQHRRGGHLPLLAAYTARLMGREPDEALLKRLAPLGDEDGFENAVKEVLAAMKVTEDEADAVFEPLEGVLLQLDLGPDPSIEIELVLPEGAESIDTTGEVVEGGRIRFADELTGGLVRRVFVATLAVPDAAWQQARFGGVPLTGEKLFRYALWIASLPVPVRGEWESAVEGLRPGPELLPRVRALTSLSDVGARLLLGALEAGE